MNLLLFLLLLLCTVGTVLGTCSIYFKRGTILMRQQRVRESVTSRVGADVGRRLIHTNSGIFCMNGPTTNEWISINQSIITSHEFMYAQYHSNRNSGDFFSSVLAVVGSGRLGASWKNGFTDNIDSFVTGINANDDVQPVRGLFGMKSHRSVLPARYSSMCTL